MILEYCDKVKLVFRFCKVLARDLKYKCLIFTWIEFQIKNWLFTLKKHLLKSTFQMPALFANTQFMRKVHLCIHIDECDTEMTISFLCWPICDFRGVQSIGKHDTGRYNGPTTVQQYLATAQNTRGVGDVSGGVVLQWQLPWRNQWPQDVGRLMKRDVTIRNNCCLTAARLCYGWVILIGYRVSGSFLPLTCSSWFSLISLIVAEYDW